MNPTSELLEFMATTEDLRRISEHLFLDQQTALPPAAIDDRARQIGWLEGQIHDRIASDEYRILIERLTAEDPDVAWLDAARRDNLRETLRPAAAQRAFASVGLQAVAAWNQAREISDWSAFSPWLQRMVDINLEVAEAMGYDDHPHDALLSLYEPGPTSVEINAIFSTLREDLVRLSRDREVAPQPASPVVATEQLLAIARDIGDLFGFDFRRGTLAISPHGYTNPAGPNDTRVTFRAGQPIAGTVGTIMHEYGHGLYEQGIAPELWGTAAGRGIMPYLHESQSKFWENIVGRRRDLMPVLSDIVQRHTGDVPGTSAEDLYAVQAGGPASMIRTESDEVSFNLHIFLRWEIETALLDGSLRVEDVPALWNERSLEYFGRAPQDDREGALQDPHWCRRYMGLFTSYVVGNIGSAQMAEAQERDGVSIPDAVAARDFRAPLDWLRTNIHAPGRTKTMHEVLTDATGSRLDAEPYRRHLVGRYSR
jgi:carboxypeptidase Taq